jgi:hypothetical protein
LIYNSLGYFLVFSAFQLAIKHQNWAQLSTLSDQELTIFTFNKSSQNSELKIINKHEIRINGKLYDVVRMKEDLKSVSYSCYYDHKEETLITKSKVLNSQTQQMPFQNKANTILEKIIKSGIFESTDNLLPANYTIINSDLSKVYYSIPTLQIAIPPPQSFC